MNVTIAAFAITTLIVQTQLWANGMWAAYTGGMLVIILLANRQTQLQSKSPAPAFAMLVAQAAVISVLTVVSDHYFLTTMLSFIPVSLSQTALPRRWANFYDGAFLIALATVYGLTVDVSAALQILLGIGAGFVFIIAFTRLAQSEALARQQLQGANAQLSEYAAQVARLATMRERNRLAREVHDSLGHYLTVINVQLEIVTKLMQSDPARAREAALKAKELAAEGLAEVRRSVSALRPSPLDDQPLAGAVGRLIDEARAAGLIVTFEQSGSTRALSPEIETVIYRAAQESLTNIRKHAHASSAEVKLRFDSTLVRLDVHDNGPGRPANKTDDGVGLAGLRERVAALGGSIRAENDPRGGFVVEIAVPYQAH